MVILRVTRVNTRPHFITALIVSAVAMVRQARQLFAVYWFILLFSFYYFMFNLYFLRSPISVKIQKNREEMVIFEKQNRTRLRNLRSTSKKRRNRESAPWHPVGWLKKCRRTLRNRNWKCYSKKRNKEIHKLVRLHGRRKTRRTPFASPGNRKNIAMDQGHGWCITSSRISWAASIHTKKRRLPKEESLLSRQMLKATTPRTAPSGNSP